jgi:hypothetical protein
MAEAFINPMVPNIGNQEAAMAGSQAVVFTATDRKIIEERGGAVDKGTTFLDVLKDKPLNTKVENEQTPIKPQEDIKELANRFRAHNRVIKHSALYIPPKEKVEISGALPDNYDNPPPPSLAGNEPEAKKTPPANIATIAGELKLNPTGLYDQFELEQEELHSLISRIHDLHLKRLLTEKEKEFTDLSTAIRTETLHSAKTSAKSWIEEQLDNLTRSAAEYKIKVARSIQALEFSEEREQNIIWLEKIVARLFK